MHFFSFSVAHILLAVSIDTQGGFDADWDIKNLKLIKNEKRQTFVALYSRRMESDTHLLTLYVSSHEQGAEIVTSCFINPGFNSNITDS